MYLDDANKRDFYIELCRLENWSSPQLQERMGSMLFERSAIPRKPEETIQHDLCTLGKTQRPSADLSIKDPYVLIFLGLNDRYLERVFKTRSCERSRRFCWNRAPGSPSSRDKRASGSTKTTSTSTGCSATASSDGCTTSSSLQRPTKTPDFAHCVLNPSTNRTRKPMVERPRASAAPTAALHTPAPRRPAHNGDRPSRVKAPWTSQ